MHDHSSILILTTISIAFIHTVLGPDHYIPFIVMSKAGGWSKKKTLRITLFSGLGHVLSSVILGVTGIIIGTTINKLEYIESARGDIAGWLLISFGIIYSVWGLRRTYKENKHTHIHKHDGEIHVHEHSHKEEHAHLHSAEGANKLTPWIIFTIFILGPCEPLIPILIYPSVSINLILAFWIVIIFSIITTGTMLLIVFAGLKGIAFIPVKGLEKYSHTLAGVMILICGISIIFLGV